MFDAVSVYVVHRFFMNAVVFLLFLRCFVECRGHGEELTFSEEYEETDKRGEQEAGFIADLDRVGHPLTTIYNPCPGHATGQFGEAFADLISAMAISSCILAAPCSYPIDVGGNCRTKTIFDFIVVGGGTAGSVVASRLSEISDWNILLLEAGTDPPITSEIPFFHEYLLKTDVDWQYQTVRESGLFNGYMGKVNRWPRGRALGGTSIMGNMLYIRGSRKDFDNMAAAGNFGWSYSEVLPYYKKSEDMRYNGIIANDILATGHSRGGPLTVSRFGEKLKITELLQDAAADMGYPINNDINGITSAGFASPNYGNVRTGERMNTAKAFLNPIKKRPNLFVIKHARVTKIHICPQTKRAYGVEYFYKNERTSRTLRASREIILSAGVIESPKLLMLSGVGPKNELDDLSIYVIQNLRVGRNLQDSVMMPALPITLQFENNTRSPLDYLDFSYEYLSRRTGPFATIGVTELVGMLNVDESDDQDIQVQFLYAILNESKIVSDFTKNIGFDEDIAVQLINANRNGDLIIPQVLLLHPRSKGVIRLKSSDPDAMPLIQAGYLDHPKDLEYILTGIRIVERLANQDFLKFYNATMEYLYYPGCCGIEPGTDYYWACALSHIVGTGHNQVGTCKMGPCEDSDAVVDPQLRVHGIKGLRVVDASIFPKSLTGSILASVVMAAEKASDMIKMLWISNFQPTFTTISPYSQLTTPIANTASLRAFS